jgi:hypothetical protein
VRNSIIIIIIIIIIIRILLIIQGSRPKNRWWKGVQINVKISYINIGIDDIPVCKREKFRNVLYRIPCVFLQPCTSKVLNPAVRGELMYITI